MQTFFTLRKSSWKDAPRAMILATIFTVGYVLSSGIAHGEGIEAHNDFKQVKAVIDFRTDNPKRALTVLTLIGDTYKDRKIQVLTTHPDFVVNFGGDSVKLLAKNAKGSSTEEQKTITAVKNKISALAKDGIKFEYCLYGAKLFGVEPADVPGMRVVDNGWVSLVSYQASGYSLVPA
jgi:intracellular sulfur oxidation DsrE/DsrF family protein